jgi:hypothetical protein
MLLTASAAVVIRQVIFFFSFGLSFLSLSPIQVMGFVSSGGDNVIQLNTYHNTSQSDEETFITFGWVGFFFGCKIKKK